MSHRRPGAPVRLPAPTLLLGIMVGSAAAVLLWSIQATTQSASWPILLPFLAAALVAEWLKVQVAEIGQQRLILSLTILVTMAAVTVQPSLAPLVSLTAALVFVVGRRRPLVKVLTNLAAPTLAAGAASGAYLLLRPADSPFTLWHLAAAFVAVLAFYTVNTGLIVLMISASTGRPLLAVARDASWFGPTNLLLGLTGAFLGGAHPHLGPIGVLMFVVPVLLLRFTLAWYARQSQQTITTLQAARTQAEAAEARYRGLFEGVADAILVTDAAGRLLEANAAAATLVAVPQAALPQLAVTDIATPQDDWPRTMLAALAQTGRWQGEVDLRRRDGTMVPVEWRATAVALPTGPVYLGALRDISQRRAVERQLAYQAFHDPLTGLPNRALFLERLAHALTRLARRPTALAVLFVDLDRFKVINDSLGHAVGDQLLHAVAQRLQRAVRPHDTVARLAGDEFTILLEDLAHLHHATRIAERILAELQAPFTLKGHEVVMTASIGIAISQFSQEQPDDLLRRADAAMYRAKRQGKAHYEVFDPSMNAHALERLELERELRRAIAQGELRVYYQPKLELATGRLAGVEALVRWQHPERGLIAPNAFIPVAEETGLILPLGRWVLEDACRQVHAWHQQYPAEPPLQLAVNLSAQQFQHPELVAEVGQVLQTTGLAPAQLVLEITETVVMEAAAGNVITLQQLKEVGVRLAIDDFGTGYSSLSYLKRFPVDLLKIDRSFVVGLGQDAEDTAIVQAVIMLAHTLGLQVIAEGIERAEQLARLQALGCEWGQGYYFAAPLPPEAADVLVGSRRIAAVER